MCPEFNVYNGFKFFLRGQFWSLETISVNIPSVRYFNSFFIRLLLPLHYSPRQMPTGELKPIWTMQLFFLESFRELVIWQTQTSTSEFKIPPFKMENAGKENNTPPEREREKCINPLPSIRFHSWSKQGKAPASNRISSLHLWPAWRSQQWDPTTVSLYVLLELLLVQKDQGIQSTIGNW